MLGGMYELNETVKAVCDLISSKKTDMSFENTLVIVTATHATGMLRFKKQLMKGEIPYPLNLFFNDRVFRINVSRKIGYKGREHTNELVGFYCIGEKADMFNKYANEYNIIDNTNIFDVLKKVIIDGND